MYTHINMKHTHTNINIIDFKRTSSLLVASISVQQNQSQQNGVRAAFKIPFIYFFYFLILFKLYRTFENLDYFSIYVSSISRGHANLLCIVPILSDVLKGTLKCPNL